MATGGYISLHRQILDWEWYHDHETFCLFIHLLLKANYEDGHFEGRVIKRGQLVTSLSVLTKELQQTNQQARTALAHLISTGEITSESTNRYRIITIVNYDKYQIANKQNNRQLTSKQQADQQANQQQYNNINNINKKINKQSTSGRFICPTVEEVQKYCDEREVYLIDPERFVDYYQVRNWELSKGRKMKDWKAAVRLWEKNERQRMAQKHFEEEGLPF